MTFWALGGGIYGLVLTAAALTQPIARRHVAVAASLSYTFVSLGAGTLGGSFWVNLLVPGGLLLAGYWLSGLFFRDPQGWLERWLLKMDTAVAAERWMSWMPRPVAELLELAYALDYVVVGGGAIYVAVVSDVEAVSYYWSLVLTSELAAFVTIPWLRSRPPRVLESQLSHLAHPSHPFFRRLNTAILDNASIQANTLPSGHVAGAVAAALGVMAVDPTVGAATIVMAGVIAVAAVAGRYHYVVDCAAGAAVPLLVSSLM